ncbi:MAG: hypothetical protein KGL04_00070, partial [Elusimicrobia bacterium]|nr:hypothetical protein [Elusimicrobiota bacterium]
GSAPHRLYHMVPEPMAGSILYPLNRLKAVHPEAAAKATAKYETREPLMAVRLPILNCLWNDVLHLSPIHPAKIKECLVETGCLAPPAPRRRFFVIDPAKLKPKCALYFEHSKDTRGRYDFLEEDFSLFDAAHYRELPEVPQAQRTYFIEKKRAGEKPLLWARTPHVFYRGELDISGVEVIDW